MAEIDTVLEKALELVDQFEEITNSTNQAPIQCAMIGLTNERKTLKQLLNKYGGGAGFSLSLEIDRIDQLIEKLKTL